MNFNDYQKKAKVMALYEKKEFAIPPLIYVTLGLLGEAGEVAEKIKKTYRDDGGEIGEEKKELLKLEMGDVLWYLSQMSELLEIKFDEVAKANLEKLASREKRGKVSGSGDRR